MNLSWSAPSQGIEKKHLELFTKETEDLLQRRVTALLWLGIVFFPLFSILDFVMAREHFILFGQYRGFFSLLMAGFLLLHHKKLISSFLIAITFCTIGSFILVLMILKIGHGGHFYYVGPLLILVGYFAVLPLHFFQAVFSGIILLLIYTVPCISIRLRSRKPVLKILKFSSTILFFFLPLPWSALSNAMKSSKDG